MPRAIFWHILTETICGYAHGFGIVLNDILYKVFIGVLAQHNTD